MEEPNNGSHTCSLRASARLNSRLALALAACKESNLTISACALPRVPAMENDDGRGRSRRHEALYKLVATSPNGPRDGQKPAIRWHNCAALKMVNEQKGENNDEFCSQLKRSPRPGDTHLREVVLTGPPVLVGGRTVLEEEGVGACKQEGGSAKSQLKRNQIKDGTQSVGR